uniref:SFRICE_013823 n=1 Tax=Spodoptera frugiperda TaxID=7108 RepID=A0A2H1W6Y4_SPOFR
MRACQFLLLLFVCTDIIFGTEETEDEETRKRILDQLTKTRTVLLDDYHLVTRQVATDVYMFRSYRTVSVVFYPVMRDVTDARFTFQSEELHLNNIVRMYFKLMFSILAEEFFNEATMTVSIFPERSFANEFN